MNTLLIVEDEKAIREGLCAIVRRGPVPVGEVLECRNGLEALELLRERQVDVMITDIRMPRMDGLELVRRIRALPAPPLVVVVSGYDEFNYAVDMFRGGVRDYLVKPVDRDKLNSVLRVLDEELEAQKRTREHRHESEKHLLRMWLLGEQPPGAPPPEGGRALLAGRYVVACAPPEPLVQPVGSDVAVLPDTGGQTVYIVAESAFDALAERELAGVSVGVSAAHSGPRELHAAYRQALEARGQAFLRGQPVRWGGQQTEYGSQSAEAETDQIVYLVGALNIVAAKQTLGQVVLFAQNGRMTPEAFAEAMERLTKTLCHTYRSVLEGEPRREYAVWCYGSIFEYYIAYCEWLERLCDALGGVRESENHRRILQAVRFLQENYLSDIDMGAVSRHVSMNYTQFSHLFKQYTGQNFLDYLKNLRLEEGKRLLRETDLRVTDVSRRSGFKNEKHFMKVFKQAVRVSPSEYRKTARLRQAEDYCMP